MPPLTDRDHSPSEIIRRLDCFKSVAAQIERGLRDERFAWGETEGEYNVDWAAQMGLHLVTETWIEEHGYRLKRGVSPVGSRYLIDGQRKLYVLECQAVRKEE